MDLVTKGLVPSRFGVVTTLSCGSHILVIPSTRSILENFTVEHCTPTLGVDCWHVVDQHIEDFEVDFHRDIFREQSSKFCFGVNAVVSIKILGQFWGPDSLELTSLGHNWLALKFQVDFWDTDIFVKTSISRS